ncbi:MAG: hypothetical protein HOQ07_11450, partial [Sinomonas sp.]|nr:hypothetical protein [Sinomonas sp.]
MQHLTRIGAPLGAVALAVALPTATTGPVAAVAASGPAQTYLVLYKSGGS